jgi:hypothetical protein
MKILQYNIYACTYMHILYTLHIHIHRSIATLPNTTCYTATHTHAYTLVLYETLTLFLAFMDSTPPLSRIIRIASNDPEEAALCSGVSSPYCDIVYIHLLCDNTLILVYTYTINLYHHALQESLYSLYYAILHYCMLYYENAASIYIIKYMSMCISIYVRVCAYVYICYLCRSI